MGLHFRFKGCRIFNVIMRTISCVFATLFLIATILVGCASSALSDRDKIDIYSSVIRKFEVDRCDQRKFPVLYIQQTTTRNIDSSTETNPILLNESVQSGITQNLGDLYPNIIWVKLWTDAIVEGIEPTDWRTIKSGGAIITLGNIYYQNFRFSQVEISISSGYLSAEGMTYIVENIYGNWRLVGSRRHWIS